MPLTKRRLRRPDPLASASAVERLLDSLRTSLPDLIPRPRKTLVALLNAVRGLYSRAPADTKRGRRARFARGDLLRVDARLRELLGRETRVGVRSFVGQYLPGYDFSRTIGEALRRGEVKPSEAHQPARVLANELGGADS